MKITKGTPTPEELAALLVALHAARSEPVPVTRRHRPPLRRPLTPGPGRWREPNFGGQS
ncbi:acyl-CoA carboxylase subunit epsilon [Nonomuraea sp. PA05]|uniref:acyl-CoA carboxylase epsilon subunit n=1 Tax=Nonomuraea sp. PA05 TaxID=2604466 RepID=UPI0011D70B4E|nr:acyl-CoA carboxylase epsilon subunit [Nonomuraea sp. PA05]TYB64344.1 acyl-CoA carboxylase subunit epsilon [Nonomuraea sp. PA05]